eukprot:gb/GECH01012751.1/.p1 GENE.gb/GECH01012751.1/~~gb/GECH01012751.1/.p1  ORF type:complete len:333 (+),score=81.38 gb/GECH01012751.1/:1-999(+)
MNTEDTTIKKTTKRRKASVTKRERRTCTRWTQKENDLLLEAINKHGEKNWSAIADYVGTKNGDQCNQHWHRVLDPKICKTPWTDEEDERLFQRVNDHGESAWKKIAEGIEGRTDIQCRHRWMMRKKYFSKEKLQTKNGNTQPPTPPSSTPTAPTSPSEDQTSVSPQEMVSDSSQDSSNTDGKLVIYDPCEDNDDDNPLREGVFSEPAHVEMEEETLEISKTSNRIREQAMDAIYINFEQDNFDWSSLYEPCFCDEPSPNLTDTLMIDALEQWHFFLTENEETKPSNNVDSVSDSINSDQSSDDLDLICAKRKSHEAFNSQDETPQKRRKVFY